MLLFWWVTHIIRQKFNIFLFKQTASIEFPCPYKSSSWFSHSSNAVCSMQVNSVSVRAAFPFWGHTSMLVVMLKIFMTTVQGYQTSIFLTSLLFNSWALILIISASERNSSYIIKNYSYHFHFPVPILK